MSGTFDFLFWKWGMGHFAHLNQDTGKIIIDKWVRTDIPKPTQAEVDQAIIEYEQHLIDQGKQDKKDYKEMKPGLKTKLDMDESQFKIFEKFFKSDKQGG